MNTSTYTDPVEQAFAEAVRLQLGEEIARLRMQLVTYREFIESHGLTPPDHNGDDLLQMWRSCRNVIRAAQECTANLGTSKELLADRWQ